MFSISAYHTPSRGDLRSFGVILTVGVLVIVVSPMFFGHAVPRYWALTLSALFAITGILIPSVLGPVHRIWIALGNVLGWINSKIILGLLFYAVVTPTRFLMQIAGRDPMHRQLDPHLSTYRVVRKPRGASHMKHQF